MSNIEEVCVHGMNSSLTWYTNAEYKGGRVVVRPYEEIKSACCSGSRC